MPHQKGDHTDRQAWDHDAERAREPQGSPVPPTEGWSRFSSVPQGTGARSPEELETLLEDALVMREREALITIFEATAVLAVDHTPSARSHEAISRLALEAWGGDQPYLAAPRRVVQAHDIALIVTDHGANVARRDCDGTWRYAIVVKSFEDTHESTHERIRP